MQTVNKLTNKVIIIIIIIQLFIYLGAELNSRWPITESARSIKQTVQKTQRNTEEK
jgi:hypothetical protein